MKYVQVRPLRDMYGFHLDPRAYLSALPDIVRDLPAGAAEFVSDPDHYDFSGARCVKDLTLQRVDVHEGPGSVSVELSLAPNEWKHESGLRIRYSDVQSFSVKAEQAGLAEVSGFGGVADAAAFAQRVDELPSLGDLQLDEVLPHPHGMSHEIAFTEGVLRVVSGDLVARWDRPSPPA
ncbi:hypothetical protein [Streptomyces sp. NBC_00525]|uniref:hypothetical protein n=1 Tax=Streptomyces sp. NBC_00525 TaxID=2903660 RepID=UPI002E81C970|nr:hypothetical protein [Streptomyces sp. NBC_00525]WUC97498.1 hypothetical protein OG710_29485 [Streptomyces sp. NBC_00525]